MNRLLLFLFCVGSIILNCSEHSSSSGSRSASPLPGGWSDPSRKPARPGDTERTGGGYELKGDQPKPNLNQPSRYAQHASSATSSTPAITVTSEDEPDEAISGHEGSNLSNDKGVQTAFNKEDWEKLQLILYARAERNKEQQEQFNELQQVHREIVENLKKENHINEETMRLQERRIEELESLLSRKTVRTDASTQAENNSFLQSRELQIFGLCLLGAVVIGGITYYVYKKLKRKRIESESISELAKIDDSATNESFEDEDLRNSALEENNLQVDDSSTENNSASKSRFNVLKGTALSALSILIIG